MPDEDDWEAYAREKVRRERLGVTVVLPKVIPPGGSGPGGQQPGPVSPPPAGPKSDGHTYDIMKTLNKSGVDWFIINTLNNLEDAMADYNSRVGAGGGYWQILRDGSNIIKTNLAIEDRFKPGAEVQGDGHVYTIQVMTVNGWLNVSGTVGDLAGALAEMKAWAEGKVPGATSGAGNYRVINELGKEMATLDNRPAKGDGHTYFLQQWKANVWDSFKTFGTKDEAIATMNTYAATGGTYRVVDETGIVISTSSPPVSKTGCFVATAAYGTDMDPRIDALRDFRDDKLMTNATGRAMVKTYYTVSPPIARGISKSPKMRAVVRALLKPIVDHLNN